MSTVMTNGAMRPRPAKTAATVTPARATYHHGDLAHALVDVATELVRRDGGDGFSLRAAAKELGVDPAAAYRHFADKDGLLRAVAVNGFVALATSMQDRIACATDAVGRFAAVGEAYVDFAVREPALFRLMFSGAPIASAEVVGVARSPSRILTDSIDELHAAGLSSVDRAGDALLAWSAVHGLAFLILDGRLGPGPHEGAIASVVEGVLAALAARARSGEHR
jgi:AcrR family transcriptional regulator